MVRETPIAAPSWSILAKRFARIALGGLAGLLPLALAEAAGPRDVVYTVVDGAGIPTPLTETPPDPDRGGVVWLDPDRGGCGQCHRIAGLPDRIEDPARAGPDLTGVADRLTEAELRLVIVNPRIRNPDSPMPAYFNVSAELAAERPELRQPRLTRREVEDIIAFLATRDGE